MGSQAPKKVSFEILNSPNSEEVQARLGCLSVKGRKDFETPGFLALSSRGVVPHISPDVLSSQTQIGGVHLALEDFTEKAVTKETPPILNVPGESPIHAFTALPISLITLMAPRRHPAVLAPVGNTNNAISVFTSTGFQVLSNKEYISCINKMKPDIVVALGDVPYGATPGTKRVAKMSDRTTEWVTELIKQKNDGQAIFAPVLPVNLQGQWEYLDRLADDLADGIDGLALYDADLLPDIPATTTLTGLPRLSLDKPLSPLAILRQVSLGMDIFTIPFIGFATDAGIALDFRFPGPDSPASETRGPLPLGIDMWDVSHAISVTPLSSSCSCYSCTTHHRAFVQHLLAAKEMLGWVLIQIHNHHIVSEFFGAIRDSIKAGTFEKDCEEFALKYESELPEKTGQGPRARGYHFKSEGPNEKKKNKTAWGNLGGDDQQVDGGASSAEKATDLEQKGTIENLESTTRS